MRIAQINNTSFSVQVLPTEFRYSPLTDMYAGTFSVPTEEGVVDTPMNLIDLQYEIYAGKWKKNVETIDEAGEPMTQQVWIDFTAPVLFDQARQTIPYGLYLLIEDYRNEPSEDKLVAINEQIAGFAFYNSMEGFVLQVSAIQ